MIIILRQNKDGQYQISDKISSLASLIVGRRTDSDEYYVIKNRNGKSGYIIRGKLALSQLISENL